MASPRFKGRKRERISNIPDVAGLDPEEFFEMSYETALKRGTGYDRLAFSLIPKSVIGSVAFAIDPFAKFRNGKIVVTPVQRSRTRTRNYVSVPRRSRVEGLSITSVRNHGSTCLVTQDSVSYTPLSTSTTAGVQPALQSVTRDTTYRTRPANSEYGEFESFDYSLSVPDYAYPVSTLFASYTTNVGCFAPNFTKVQGEYRRFTEGGCAYFPAASLASLRTSSISELSLLLPKGAIDLLPKTIPEARRYSLFRNIAELKDLPRMITQLRNALGDLSVLASSYGPSISQKVFSLQARVQDIPAAYVSYHFGWRQLYRDVKDLLDLPAKLSKEINFLISRNGKPTTYRSKKSFPGTSTASPGFIFDLGFSGEYGPAIQTEHKRQHEIRLVVNAIFEFPDSVIPQLRRDLVEKKLGSSVTPTDVYNLIPWSWLIDWFTGLGNYVECIDAINSDKSTFNWGFVTGVTTGTITTTRQIKHDQNSNVTYNGVPTPSSKTISLSVDAVLEYKTQIRRSIANLSGVKLTSSIGSLSLYQQSILGSILLSRSQGSNR